ncbi:TNF receptor-associated factor 5 isoform X2 [Panthera pardus]|uniref:TNF receptor-associated factor n=4 Tax=Felidae TaxID=9681 RepID=A0ABI7W7V0_FELCA|nr:TNF receptor-associated factor 5 isoform X2 [Felis catus]XP_019284709.1 TNF receptor-associated factor 5 isoform X2 [Panthera pardus]XP_026930294.1 TNF receptor-associated factor 5 isoform X2 [Acinonyx jubatus]XP_043424888.1 TNF receptor-associated factor 5 isoform X2 [Prionailurus bengalensis]XP_045308402.1 TNF receptor-associated factor 5 isoform X2 [Leopardus geoffroyi]XP_049490150.1 TNF receptor-associated factor 5 isoform X2 [Panthera uncia]
MAYSEEQGGVPCGFIRQNSGNSISLDFEPNTEYRFVEQLEERYKCAFCHSVLHNPHQTGCGHRFCQHCILSLRELNAVPLCPVDKEVIKSQEVFKDNCCKREVLNLYVYCKNAPSCNAKIILGRYQNHEENLCPEYPVSCPNKCLQMIPRSEVDEHLAVCPEAEQDCPFKHYGCTVKDKRGNLLEHEHSALRDHMLLVLEKNFQLEEQISDLYKSLEQKESKIQQLAETVKKFEKEFKQFAQLLGKNGSFLSNIQALASLIDKSAWLEAQVRQLLQVANQQQNKFDLRPLVEAIDTVKQKITLLETNDQRLVVLEGETNKHDAHINIHKAQLNKNEERFKLLEGACYNGKLIWKVTDYKTKKREALDGHTVSIFSQPFYTSRCGYRLCARAYLNGDGSGKGTHLSLYFVVMRGEFDSLLQWPFRQRVTLMLLDQSGKKNHIMETFKADPNSSSFKRPDGEMNIASGCPRFVAHSTLESAKNTYIKDDTVFLKVAVDLTDLEDL